MTKDIKKLIKKWEPHKNKITMENIDEYKMSEMLHRDINGNTIHIGDVITVHMSVDRTLFSEGFTLFGDIGIVEKFGCIGVRLSEDTKYVQNEITYFEDFWVEVIGKL